MRGAIPTVEAIPHDLVESTDQPNRGHSRARALPTRALRLERGLTTLEVCSLTGLGATTVQQFESGRQKPSAATLEVLSSLYGVSPADLMAAWTQARDRAARQKERRRRARREKQRDSSAP